MPLQPVRSTLAGKLVVLASSSPRRLEILRNAGLRVEVVPSRFTECLDKRPFAAPQDYAVATARHKALEVARRMPLRHRRTPDMVIGADTIVTVEGAILEKPRDKDHAYRMLSSLSGKEHSVFTGVAIVLCHEGENEEVCYQLVDFYEETKVKFADLSDELLWEYVDSGEPMDKAGGYGIQALGGMLVEYVHGDFHNVVGFPLNRFCKQLNAIFGQAPPPAGHARLQNAPAARPGQQVTGGGASEDAETPSVVDGNGRTAERHDLELPPPHRVAQAAATPRGDGQPGDEDLQRLLGLIDGFKASKVRAPRGGAEGGATGGSWEGRRPGAERRRSARCRSSLSSPRWSEMPRPGPAPAHRGRGLGQRDSGSDVSGLDAVRRRLRALFAASGLGVFDLLHASPGLDAAQVARSLGASAGGAERLLEACASLGLLRTSAGTAAAAPRYRNSDLASRFLVQGAGLCLRPYVRRCDRTAWPLFARLESAVLEGRRPDQVRAPAAAAAGIRGVTPGSVQDAARGGGDDDALAFVSAMDSFANVAAGAVATAFDLSGYDTACDLGGCTGATARQLTQVHPGLSVVVFDLPAVVQLSQRFPHGGGRVSFLAGDFLKDPLPRVDLYILSRVLHDLTEDELQVLLGKIADACGAGGALLLSEVFLEEDRSGPSRALLQALGMSAGRQRSAAEYAELLRAHGFIATHVAHTRSLLDAMLCTRAGPPPTCTAGPAAAV